MRNVMFYTLLAVGFVLGLLSGTLFYQRELLNMSYHRDAWREFAISKSQGPAKALDEYITLRAQKIKFDTFDDEYKITE